MGRYRALLVGGLLGVAQGGFIYWVAKTDSIPPVSDVSGIALGLIQLVALFAPALALFMQAMLRYSEDKQNQPLGVGTPGIDPDVFRLFVLFGGFASSLSLINGLLILLVSLDLPAAIDLAVIPIALGLLIIPVMLGQTFYYEYRAMRASSGPAR